MKDLKENLFNETLRAVNRVRLATDNHGLRTDEYVPAHMAQMHNRYVSPGLPRCVTGASKSGVCGNRECIERHGIGCCIACPERNDCNVTCGWLEELATLT